MEVQSSSLAEQRIAVVTGGNKGIGLEICRSLASKGVKVVLTSRDERRGLEAIDKLRASGDLSDDNNIVFHQLDVTDPASVATLADFVKNKFGKLDNLVNNAAISGVVLNSDAFRKAVEDLGDFPLENQANWDEIGTQSYELAGECLETNYFGAKRVTEALLPLLQLSDSARIVNVSSGLGLFMVLRNEWAIGVLGNVENLTEDKVDGVVNQFLKDFREDQLNSKGWPAVLSGYTVSKGTLNAYTRVLAKKYPKICSTCVTPGFVKTDLGCNVGLGTAAEGAEYIVRVAMLPGCEHSGLFFNRDQVSPF